MLKAFAVLDTKASAFMAPVFMPTPGLMIRAFSDAVNNPQHDFNKHPGDYRLACIGSFDPDSGVLTGLDKPEWLGFGVDFLVKG
jgi:hypothetical protein